MSETNNRLNDLFSSTLSKLATVSKKKGEIFQSRAYEKAEERILLHTKDITSYKDLQNKPNFGPKIINKLKEIETTGKLSYLEKAENDPLQVLTNVYGIGPKKAEDLISKDIRTISDLKNNTTLLTDAQKTGLLYFEDIEKRIPREKISEYETQFKSILKTIDENANLEIVGSYRRKVKTSGDIDVIISHSNNDETIFLKFLGELKNKNIIIDFLSKGKTKSLTVAKLDDDIARRIDFLYSSSDEYPFAILYFTGSKAFNTVMRHYCLKNGYSLNEHGLYKIINGKKAHKVERKFASEKEIFDFLNLEYKSPENRIDGNAVISVKIENNNNNSNNKTPTMTSIMDKLNKNIENTTKNKDCESKKCGLESAPSNVKFYSENKTIQDVDDEDIPPPSIKPSIANFNNKQILDSITKKMQKNITETEKIDENTIVPDKKEKKRNYKQLLDKFKKDGYDSLKTFSENELSLLIKRLNDFYYNEDPLVSDNEFDIIKEYLTKQYPNNKVLSEIGAPVKKSKITLPYFMASMDKIKPETDALEKWKNKYSGNYVISAKLDGISGLYSTEEDEPKLYTRGNGEIGQDISDLIPYFKLPADKNITIRGEFIIQKELFENKYASDFSNARNFVAGVINGKKIDKQKYYDIDFIAYEVIKPSLKPSEQIELLEKLHVDTVLNNNSNDLSNEELSALLLNWRDIYKYEIDGIIVVDNKVYPRENKNPDYGFAFKMVISDQIAEAKVLDVLWDPSKDGYLKPRIRIEPVVLGGAKIEYATAFNAAFVEKNKLNIGAMVKLIRSGDVIPHIMDVVTPASEAKFPDVNYDWNDSHIDIILENKNDDETVIKKNIEYFFKTIDVENLGPGIVNKLVKADFNSISKILEMTVSDFQTIEGIKEKTSLKIYTSIENKIEKASLAKIMTASNIFGHSIAEKKINTILENYNNVLEDDISDDEKIQKIVKIKGMAEKTAKVFVKHIPEFIEFIKEIKLTYKMSETENVQSYITTNNENINHELYGKHILFTGIRDKELIEKLENEYKVNISNSVSKNTYLVIAKDPNDNSSKVAKAKELNIDVLSKEQFNEKYPDL